MSSKRHTIIYTHTDEAPALATRSLLPVVNAFTDVAGVQVELRDISLSGRVLASFPEALTPEQRVSDDLAELGELVNRPEANVIKLPNVSASIPQLKATIEELRGKGFMLPDYPDEPATPEEIDVQARYDKVKGSAVNPVLRQGNSDRRAPLSVKNYAKSHPHKMGAWSPDSKTHVSTMGEHDFRSNEQSVTFAAADDLKVELVAADGSVTVLKESIPVLAGEIVDATFMSARALDAFLAEQIADAQAEDVLFSIHLKATMMKVSDPILFGHAVKTYFADVFAKHADTFERIGVNANDGLADVLTRVATLPDAERAAIEADIAAALASSAALAMVDSDRGITNLHVPSDIIIDASMPPMIRDSGKMWNAAGELQDTKAVIPDSSYAGVYAAVVDDCRAHGAFDPATMGSVAERRAHGAAGRGVRLARQDLRDPRRRHRARREPRRRRRDAARGRGGRRLARLPGEGRARARLGRARGPAGAPLGDAHRLLARRDAGARRAAHRQGAGVPPRARHVGADDRDHGAGRRLPLLARAHPPRRGHHLGHRQRAARLPHRPVPDHGARHQRQDALDRAAHERRRPVRDGRGRLGAEARAAVREGEPPALGLARRVPRAGGVARVPRPGHRQRDRAAARRHARPRHRLGARRGPVARRARCTSSTTAAATSTWRSTGPRSWRRRPTIPSWRPSSRRSPRRSAPTRSRSSPSSTRCRARRSTSAATTSPTTTWSPRRCVRARPSTPSSTPSEIRIRSAPGAEHRSGGPPCCSPS